MKAGYRRTSTQDEQELERKRREFHALERRLARLEHDLEDLREEIREFEKFYAEKMADRIHELDQLRQELARARRGAGAGAEPREGAERRRHGLRDEEPESEDIPRVQPGTAAAGKSEGLRDVYRRVAKAIHPDFADSDEDRRRRQKLMAEANRAYAEEDRVTLQAILEEWETSPETAVAVGTAGELALVIRRIARVVERIRNVELEMARLRNTDLYRLIQRVKDARWRGRDIITEMASRLDAEILATCRALNELGLGRRSDHPAGAASAPQSPPADTLRIVRFPADRTLGTLFVRERNSGSFLDWKRLGEAAGDVAVPAGKGLRLDVPEETIDSLPLLETLQADDLQACFLYGIADDDLSHILRLTGIRELYLSGEGITGEGIVHLLELKNLERLYLYDTQVGDAGLACLKYLPRLRSLTISNAPVTDGGLDRLRLALPGCRVVILQSGRRG
uniref:J domain-containing protein n=1 Tax=Geobacter metallireducens TaxID=28232 RepID=A0A831UB27_GEOME